MHFLDCAVFTTQLSSFYYHDKKRPMTSEQVSENGSLWHIAKDGRNWGKFSTTQVKEGIRLGNFSLETTLAWKKSMDCWLPLGKIQVFLYQEALPDEDGPPPIPELPQLGNPDDLPVQSRRATVHREVRDLLETGKFRDAEERLRGFLLLTDENSEDHALNEAIRKCLILQDNIVDSKLLCTQGYYEEALKNIKVQVIPAYPPIMKKIFDAYFKRLTESHDYFQHLKNKPH